MIDEEDARLESGFVWVPDGQTGFNMKLPSSFLRMRIPYAKG